MKIKMNEKKILFHLSSGNQFYLLYWRVFAGDDADPSGFSGSFGNHSSGFLHYRKRKKGEEFSVWNDSAFSHAVLYQSFVYTYGDRVLFTWWNDRPYTLEALAYGTSLAAMVVTILFMVCFLQFL